MPRLALYTFGVLTSPLADPAPLTHELHDRSEPVYRQISRHPGYLAHAEAPDADRGSHFDLDWGAWGAFAVPSWYTKGRTADTLALATTLSLWTGLRPAFDAIYTGPHREALNRRYDWFERTAHPEYAFWWVPDDVTPTWQDGVSRLEHLHAHGPAPHAFTFPHPFTPTGTPTSMKGQGQGQGQGQGRASRAVRPSK
ncbi:DUF3291 domain-containing protein [Streptomyces sp. WAC06614]|uniref:DUF3291 domain-containing protein n=1 Tax=Streptomyces sp. WAC06614 TaxID=2487416 RepID=UPI000F79EFF4|nr:DUF3291 domain-containing protein [Streptomyces sp. WAC06614]RSS63440.1 DUF3291 domain-containing protein [Streptomyces sp. WAC06614]